MAVKVAATARYSLRDTSAAGDFPSLFGLAGEDDEEVMKRRAFLMGLAALTGLSAAEPGMALESTRHGLNYALAERHASTDVDEWHEIALEYGHTYPITAPNELLKTLLVDLYGLQAAIGRYPDDETQRELRQAGAMLSAFTAQTIANLGYLREARRWWRTARRAADESEDRYTMLWVRGREIVRAGYEHRPLTTILQLIDEAEARVDASPPAAAMPEFLSGKAQALALMGSAASAETETTLIRLRRAFGSCRSRSRPPTTPYSPGVKNGYVSLKASCIHTSGTSVRLRWRKTAPWRFIQRMTFAAQRKSSCSERCAS